MSKSKTKSKIKKDKSTKKAGKKPSRNWLNKKFYQKELERLQFELVKLQYWVIEQGVRVVVL